MPKTESANGNGESGKNVPSMNASNADNHGTKMSLSDAKMMNNRAGDEWVGSTRYIRRSSSVV
jgi:hypothetical protein